MSLADYAGRTYDVSAFQNVSASTATQLAMTLADTAASGTICTGLQKLAQRFLLELLTVQGSLPFLPLRGTNFLTTIRSGRIRTETDVFAAFSLAVGLIEQNLSSEATTTDPDDELFASANLTRVALHSSTIGLTIQLTSAAGTSQRLIVPIDILA